MTDNHEPKAPELAAIVCDGSGMSGGAIVRWAGSATPCPPETQLVTLGAAIAYAESLAAHRVAQERDRCINAEAAREQRWTDWLVEHGLLHYYQSCRRPDGSHGPAWVLRTPYMTRGDSCEAWSVGSAADALRSFLRSQDTQPPETGKEQK